MCKLVYIRTADIKDRDNVWPLARDFASSFVLDRTCFDASFDLLLTRPDTLLLIAERSQTMSSATYSHSAMPHSLPTVRSPGSKRLWSPNKPDEPGWVANS